MYEEEFEMRQETITSLILSSNFLDNQCPIPDRKYILYSFDINISNKLFYFLIDSVLVIPIFGR